MPVKKSANQSKKLAEMVISGMQDYKAKDIVSLDLTKVKSSVCNYFIICHGTSRTQVEAIADAVEDKVRIQLKEKPWHREGLENAEWVLLDYVDVVVHIFQAQTRQFYQLEKLWADAVVLEIPNEE
jgi:ribosome-associated protein